MILLKIASKSNIFIGSFKKFHRSCFLQRGQKIFLADTYEIEGLHKNIYNPLDPPAIFGYYFEILWNSKKNASKPTIFINDSKRFHKSYFFFRDHKIFFENFFWSLDLQENNLECYWISGCSRPRSHNLSKKVFFRFFFQKIFFVKIFWKKVDFF